MERQDRQGVRTASDLERKYKFRETFAKVLGIANDAQESAKQAKDAAVGLDSKLDQDEIFKRLTNDGKSEGIYRDENGDIYINASYIVSGILKSKDELVYFDLDTGRIVAKNEHVEGVETRLTSTGLSSVGTDCSVVIHPEGIGIVADGDKFSLRAEDGRVVLGLLPCDDVGWLTFHELQWKTIAGIPMVTDPAAEFSFAELGVNATAAEMNRLVGVKDNLQTQLDALEARIKALEG